MVALGTGNAASSASDSSAGGDSDSNPSPPLPTPPPPVDPPPSNEIIDDVLFLGSNSVYPKTFEPPRALPTSWDECCTLLLPTMATVHLLSRPLARLPPTELWDRELRGTWKEALCKTGLRLLRALSAWERTGNGLLLLQGVIDYLGAPSHFIVPASSLQPNTGTFTLELPGALGSVPLSLPQVPGRKGALERGSRFPPHSDPPASQAGGHPLAKIALRLIRKRRQKKATKILTGLGCARRAPTSCKRCTWTTGKLSPSTPSPK